MVCVSIFLCTPFFFSLSVSCLSHFKPYSFSQTFFFFFSFFVNGRQYVITWAELSVWPALSAPHPLQTHNENTLFSSNTHSVHTPRYRATEILIHTKCILRHTCTHINTGLPSWKCTAAAVYPVETRKTSCTVLRVKTSPQIINISPRHSLKLHFGWFLWPSRQRSPPAVQLDRQFGVLEHDSMLLNILDFEGMCAMIRLL